MDKQCENKKIEMNIVAAFQEIVCKYPDRIALTYKKRDYTYQQMNKATDLIANGLILRGLKRKDTVAIYMDRSDNYVLCMIGILKAGCTYVPLSKQYPKQRIERILQIAQVKATIVDQEVFFDERIVESTQIIPYQEIGVEGKKTCTKYEVTVKEDDLAYILFTSGSTGAPKGVAIYHKSVVNLGKAMHYEAFGATIKNEVCYRVGVFSTFAFDITVGQIYGALLNGHTLNVMDDSVKLSVDSFLQYIKNEKIDVIELTPTYLNIVIQWIQFKAITCNLPHKIISGGEALPFHLLKRFYEIPCAEHVKIINAYGPTETCVFATIKIYDKDKALQCNQITIGKPLKNYRVYIVKDHQNITAKDVEGEIWIAGVGVAAGYIQLIEKTNQVFIKNPDIDEEVIYRTGDIGKITEEGEFLCLGRMDDQVKISGFRIELQDIEKNIEALPDISQCKVITANQGTEKILVAYFTYDKEASLETILAALKEKLPDYMIPTYFVPIKEFTMGINGKVDKTKLPDYQEKALRLADSKETNTKIDDLSKQVLHLISDLLNRTDVNFEHNFFELGGTSLQIHMLAIQVWESLQVVVDIAQLYQCKTIEDIIKVVKNTQKKVHDCQAMTGEVKAIFNQQRMFINGKKSGMRESKNGFLKDYDILFLIHSDEIFQEQRLQEAVKKVCEIQDGLRCSFFRRKNAWYFTIKEHLETPFIVQKIQDELRDEKIFEYIQENYEEDAMFRLYLFQGENNSNCLAVHVSHSIFDFASLQILLNELFLIYDGGQVRGFVHNFSDYIANIYPEQKKEHLQFWKKYLFNRPYVYLFQKERLKDFYVTFKSTDTFQSIEFEYTKESQDHLLHFCEENKSTLFITLVSILGIQLMIRTCQMDLIIGIHMTGRMDAQDMQRIGSLTNQEYLRFQIQNDMNFVQVTEIVWKQYVEVMKHQVVPLNDIYNIQTIEDMQKGNIFGILFNYIDLDSLENMNHHQIQVEMFDRIADYAPITWTVYKKFGRLKFEISYHETLLKKEFMEEITKEFVQISERLIQCKYVNMNEIKRALEKNI